MEEEFKQALADIWGVEDEDELPDSLQVSEGMGVGLEWGTWIGHRCLLRLWQKRKPARGRVLEHNSLTHHNAARPPIFPNAQAPRFAPAPST